MNTSTKKPRLFEYSEGEDCWLPASESAADIVSLDELLDGEEVSVRFKRIDMTDDEFNSMPEV